MVQRSSPPERAHTRTRSRERYREIRRSNVAPTQYRETNRSYAHAQRNGDEGSVYSADWYEYDDPDGGFQLSALDPGGYRLLLARDYHSIVHQRLTEFMQFKRKAAALQQAVS